MMNEHRRSHQTTLPTTPGVRHPYYKETKKKPDRIELHLLIQGERLYQLLLLRERFFFSRCVIDETMHASYSDAGF